MSTCAGSRFLKLHAAGNDFIAPEELPPRLEEWAKGVCRRRLGVGADGVIYPLPHPELDFEFLYINYLGKRVPFCGHATRALAWLAVERGLAKGPRVRFWAWGKAWEARVQGRWVELSLGEPGELSKRGEVYFLKDPVEHAVVFVQGLWNLNLWELRRELGEPSVNLNFAEEQEGKLLVRTLEHGYPEEPLSCGTGAAAAGLVYLRLFRKNEVRVITKGGELSVRLDGGKLLLGGEITPVYEGALCD